MEEMNSEIFFIELISWKFIQSVGLAGAVLSKHSNNKLQRSYGNSCDQRSLQSEE